MLDSIRNHKRLMLFILVILVFPAFVFFGMQFNNTSHSANEVASVAGIPITRAQLDDAHKNWVRNVMEENANIDIQQIDTPEYKRLVLDNMVREYIVAAAVQGNRLFISDSALRTALLQRPDLQQFIDESGNFDYQAYEQRLRANRMKPRDYEESVRAQVGQERLLSAVSNGFVSQTEVDILARMLSAKYVIHQQVFALGEFADEVTLSEEDLRQYYEQNQIAFMSSEFADIEYVVLSPEALAARVTVTEDEVRQYFTQNDKLFIWPQERRASHILVAVDKFASQEDRATARAKAEQLLAAVRQDPAKFTEIAQADSDDTSSAVQGGDVGYFKQGAMVEPFDHAVFAMTQEGQISDLVSSDYGYHIILLTGIKPERTMTFDEAKAAARKQLVAQRVNEEFSKAADEFMNDVYVNSVSLQPVADKFGLSVEKVEHVLPVPAPGAHGPLADAAFLKALFTPQARESRQNIQAVQISPTELASGRVVQYTPARVLPYEEVQDRVKEMAMAAKTAELARAAGEKALQDWQQSPELVQAAPELTVTRQTSAGLMPQAANKLFSYSSASQLPQIFGVDMQNDGYVVIALERVDASKPVDEKTRAMLQAILLNQSVGAQEAAYMDFLADKYEVKTFP